MIFINCSENDLFFDFFFLIIIFFFFQIWVCSNSSCPNGDIWDSGVVKSSNPFGKKKKTKQTHEQQTNMNKHEK